MFVERLAIRFGALMSTILTVAVVPLSAVQSQPSPASARTILDGYVAEAIGANLMLAQQRAQVDRANAQVRESRGRFLPSLDVNARYSEVSGVVNIGDFINPAYGALNQLIGLSLIHI